MPSLGVDLLEGRIKSNDDPVGVSRSRLLCALGCLRYWGRSDCTFDDSSEDADVPTTNGSDPVPCICLRTVSRRPAAASPAVILGETRDRPFGRWMVL